MGRSESVSAVARNDHDLSNCQVWLGKLGRMKVDVTHTKCLFDGFFRLDCAYLKHQTPNGKMSPPMTRLNVERGDGAAVLLLNSQTNCLIMTRQFRYACWLRDDGGWITEIPAGTVGPGQSPEQVAHTEVIEEVGYKPVQLQFMMKFYASPGTTTERVHLYYGQVTDQDRVGDGGGLENEHEYIEVIHVPVPTALKMLEQGAWIDAKSLVAIQWLMAQHRL